MKPIINVIFREFDRSDITFCHWKSNQRLHSFVNGKEDLDLLFREEDKDLVLSLMYNLGARKFEAIPIGKYQYIYDYLIVDDEGILIHFHVHFGLDIGEKGIKRYRLPFVNAILESRIRSNPEEVWVPAYGYELLLLLLRLSLRFSPLVYRKYMWMKSSYNIDKKANSELKWLREMVSFPEFEKIVFKHFEDEIIIKSLLDLYSQDQTANKILTLRSALSVKRLEWMNKSDSYVNYRYVVNRFKLNKLNRIMSLMPSKRISASGGRTVVILGSDGAGKSTLVKNLGQSFSSKIDVCNLYMGLPKPSKSNNPLLAKVFRKLGLFPLWNVMVKKSNISKGNKLKSQGALVLCDRFPQHYHEGIMDGPLLDRWSSSSNPIKKYISKLENDLFEGMANKEIDLVVKLIVDSETSARRGKHSLKMAEHKTRILSDLYFSNAKQTIEIDASTTPEEQVAIEASKAIWNLYK
jgi:adenylate kinase family enzyme